MKETPVPQVFLVAGEETTSKANIYVITMACKIVSSGGAYKAAYKCMLLRMLAWHGRTARRARKAATNRILTLLKAALNRAFDANRVLFRQRLAQGQALQARRRGGGALSQCHRGEAAGQGMS